MKTKFTVGQVLLARRFWGELTYVELREFWVHYTVGKGRGIYSAVYPETPFADYLVESAAQTEFERQNDI